MNLRSSLTSLLPSNLSCNDQGSILYDSIHYYIDLFVLKKGLHNSNFFVCYNAKIKDLILTNKRDFHADCVRFLKFQKQRKLKCKSILGQQCVNIGNYIVRFPPTSGNLLIAGNLIGVCLLLSR